ncbi:MAG: hypothetical protein LBC74_12145 [Planctomycetaceae bacterium]|jgi:hypothetical protein|nr:hypothetical protein [Planctomycetaceae bacterium]
MSTLIYFASGAFKPEYENLPFDNIYLIDLWSFKNKAKKFENPNDYIEFEPLRIGKVTCVNSECLKAVNYLKSQNVKADCYVTANTSCHSRPKRCPLGLPFFIGYVMPILKDDYVHITNLKKYYGSTDKNVIDLPYEIDQITKDDNRYIDPAIFVHGNTKDVEIFRMRKKCEVVNIAIDSKIKISVIRDSIWNYYDKLDLVVHSVSDFERRNFFDRIPKVITWNHLVRSKRVYCLYSLSENVWQSKFEISNDLDAIFAHCVQNKINKVGFMPWGNGNYNVFVEKIQNYKNKYPKEIILFHLNKNDYKELTTKYAIKSKNTHNT